MQLGESAVDDLNLFRLLKYQEPLPQIDPEKRKEDKQAEDDKKREAYNKLI